MSWRVADYDGTPTKEAFCPYWRCSGRVEFEMHERVKDGEVVEAEYRCSCCGHDEQWAKNASIEMQARNGDRKNTNVNPAQNGL